MNLNYFPRFIGWMGGGIGEHKTIAAATVAACFPLNLFAQPHLVLTSLNSPALSPSSPAFLALNVVQTVSLSGDVVYMVF